MYFNDWLVRRQLYTPTRVAIVDDADGRSYTYGELAARAARIAGHMKRWLGVGPGDRVACLSTNCIELIDLYFACGKLGAVLVPLNYRLPATAIVELLKDCRPRVLVYESSFLEIADAARQACEIPERLPVDGGSPDDCERTLQDVLAASGGLGDSAEFLADAYAAREDEVAMILYTSGTTGRPKGAMISWRQVHWNALNTVIGLQLTERDTAFLNMPLYHTGGWHVLLTPLMLLGGRIILQKRFDASRCNVRVGPEGVTILFGVPTMLRMMWESPDFAAADFSRVRFAICGGEPCPLPVIEAYRQRGIAIRQGYGLTEAGPNCFSLPAEDAIKKRGSIGFPNFHIGTRLVAQDGSDVGCGEVGELWMKGPHTFAGYWDAEEETADTLRDGWVRTGDLMRRDDEGYYFVVGRCKEMYVSGGENVYPAQIERILQKHQTIGLAAVVAVPDPRWGETGWAFVQASGDCTVAEAEILDWCRQHLAKYQCPARVVVLHELPIGHSGKIDKLTLQERAVEMSATS